MELAPLLAFTKVVQAGSFTAAAALLGSDKARLSRTVAALERDLGLRLLERSTRSLRLTDSGRAVYERAIGILGASDELLQFARSLQAEPQGTLRLTTSPDFALIAANRWVSAYLQRWPQVAVEAEYTSRRVDLVHEDFDLALRVGPLDDSRLAARLLGSLRYALVASPAYLARAGAPATPDALRRHALLMFATGSGHSAWTLLPPAAAADPAVQRIEHRAWAPGRAAERTAERPGMGTRVRAGSITLLLDACLAGLGIARLPRSIAAAALADGRLQAVLPGWTPQPVPVHAVFPSNRFIAPKLRAFVDLAVAEFDADEPGAA